MHNCQLIQEFLDEYADINIPYAYPIDRLSILAREMKEQDQDREQEQYQDQNSPLTPQGIEGEGGYIRSVHGMNGTDATG